MFQHNKSDVYDVKRVKNVKTFRWLRRCHKWRKVAQKNLGENGCSYESSNRLKTSDTLQNWYDGGINARSNIDEGESDKQCRQPLTNLEHSRKTQDLSSEQNLAVMDERREVCESGDKSKTFVVMKGW